jgi:hypothetical protein
MKKKLKKAQYGTSTFKTKEVSTSPDGMYKTKEIHKVGPKGTVDKSKTRRTIKGVLAGAPKPNRGSMAQPIFPSPTPPPPPPAPPTRPLMVPPPSKKPLMTKKGGAVKKKK